MASRMAPAKSSSPRQPAADGLGYLVRLAAHHDESFFVGDGPVEGQPVQVVLFLAGAHLGDGKFHLERFLLRGEDGTEALRVDAGQSPGRDVLPVVGVAADVRVPHPGLAEAFEFVVLADRGERDLVVDLADLVQRRRRVLRHEGDPVPAADHHHRAAPGDAFPCEIRTVLHQLFGRNIELLGHLRPPAGRGPGIR